MVTKLTSANLPPQLRGIWAQAQYLPDAVRGSLTVTLFSAPDDATPERVLADAFARLGYLPGEAKQAASKVLPKGPRALRRGPAEAGAERDE